MCDHEVRVIDVCLAVTQQGSESWQAVWMGVLCFTSINSSFSGSLSSLVTLRLSAGKNSVSVYYGSVVQLFNKSVCFLLS